MLKQKTNRKLLYPIGLISLSLLPLLCFGSFYQQFMNTNSGYALEVTYWSPRDTAYFPNPLKFVNDKFTKITLTGEEEDKIKLEYAQIAIRELLHEKGTTPGIEFTFTDNAKYSSLVNLFNLCEIENASAHLSYQNKFWVFKKGTLTDHSDSRASKTIYL